MFSDSYIVRDKKRNIFMRCLINLRKIFSKKKRKRINEQLSVILNGVDYTIFCNNCLGGVFYHDVGKQFTSPTINLSMDGECFINFLTNPQKYKDAEFAFVKYPGYDYPIAHLLDIELHFVHYKTEEECIKKWRERFERVVWSNIFVIATDHDGMYQDDLKEKFDKLPYENKIMFVASNKPKYKWEVPVKQFFGRNNVQIMTSFANFKGERYYETAFNIAKWIKENTL